MSQIRVTLKTGKPVPKYSEAFKREVVREYEKGLLNKEQLQRKYGIGGNSRVLSWCRKYGKLAYPHHESTGRPMKDPQKQRIKELERKLRQAEEKIRVYDKLIEVTNRELDADIIKKIEAKLSASWQQKKDAE